MADLSMCRTCLRWESRMHHITSTKLQELFEKLTDSKLNSERMPKVMCYVCYAQLQKCCRFVELSRKAGQVLSEFILNSSALSKTSDVKLSTYNILNVHMGNCYSNNDYDVDVDDDNPDTIAVKDELQVISEDEIDFDVLGVVDKMETEDAVDNFFEYSINSNDCPEKISKEDNFNKANVNTPIDIKILKQETSEERFHVDKDPLINCKYVNQTVPTIIERKIVNRTITKTNHDIHKNNIVCNSLSNTKLVNENYFDVIIENPTRSGAYKNKPGSSLEPNNVPNKLAIGSNLPSQRSLTGTPISGDIAVGSSNDNGLNLTNWNCDICGKSFSRKTDLLRHKRRNHGEKLFPCKFCSKSFVIKSRYESHSRIHTGEKPFTCDYCAKTFSQSGVLVRHMLIHTGEKPYACSECDKRFSDKSTLSRHMIIHSEKQFTCKTCGKIYRKENTLRRHMSSHTGEKLFSCDICSLKYTYLQPYLAHLEQHKKTES